MGSRNTKCPNLTSIRPSSRDDDLEISMKMGSLVLQTWRVVLVLLWKIVSKIP